MFKHSATRTHEIRTRAASGVRAITAILTVATVIVGLGGLLALANNVWLLAFGICVALITGTLGVAVSFAAEVRADARVAR
ncbi:MAG: hypothetical protein QM713_10095 [Arachnia sp.]